MFSKLGGIKELKKTLKDFNKRSINKANIWLWSVVLWQSQSDKHSNLHLAGQVSEHPWRHWWSSQEAEPGHSRALLALHQGPRTGTDSDGVTWLCGRHTLPNAPHKHFWPFLKPRMVRGGSVVSYIEHCPVGSFNCHKVALLVTNIPQWCLKFHYWSPFLHSYGYLMALLFHFSILIFMLSR